MKNEELVKLILSNLGKDNVVYITNCSTRLRASVKDDQKVSLENLEKIDGVLAVIHDKSNYYEIVLGPGIVQKCAEICVQMGIPSNEENKQTSFLLKVKQRHGRFKENLKVIGEIFIPLIPGVIVAGLCAGLNALIAQVWPGYVDNKFLYILYNILACISDSFLAYIAAWVGYNAAIKFNATPILGGMLGMISSLSYIDNIAKTIGLYNNAQPLNSILKVGRGGILAVIAGVWLLSKIEKFVRNKMPDNLDVVFTSLVSLLITLIIYILFIMPLTGFISRISCAALGAICMSNSPIVRGVAGFLASSLFLPMVAMGMHHGLVALYTIELNEIGYVVIYPALAMAGAGQVGAALAIYLKAKKGNNKGLIKIIRGALPAGILGIGEPLIYGVTLPMGRPFLTAGIGAGFGGTFVMIMQVGATTWGTSGVLGALTMTAGPHGTSAFIYYLIGLVISYIMGFIVTNFVIKEEVVAKYHNTDCK